jgi:hypothetical protein
MTEPKDTTGAKVETTELKLAMNTNAPFPFLQRLKKNYKWIVLIGSVIASGTVGIREVVHEKATKLIESIEAEKQNSETRALMRSSVDHAKRFERQKVLSDDLKPLHLDAETSAIFVDLLNEMYSFSTDMETKLADIHPLIDKTRALEKERLTRQYEDCHQDQTEFYNSIRQLQLNINGSKGLLGPDIWTEIKLVKGQEPFVDSQVSDLRDAVDSAIEIRVESLTKLSSIFSWVSGCIITIGIALSVVAQMVGKPGEAPEVKL